MKIVTAGVSGLIGKPLVKSLAAKYEVVSLRRSAAGASSFPNVREVIWDGRAAGEWQKEIDGAYAVINLAGEPIVNKRWTPQQKKKIRDSRTYATKAIVQAIAAAKIKPKVLVNASAIGFYGARDSAVLDETAKAGSGFLPEVCREWEAEAWKARDFGVRTVLVRTGIVLAREGGALRKMLLPFKLFIGGPLGSGKQMMSWVHLEDEVGGILKALEDSNLEGPINLTAPGAVTMAEFARTLGHVLGRPSFFPVPEFVLKILLGEMSDMLLTGQNIYPKKLTQSGFRFRFETLEKALRDLL